MLKFRQCALQLKIPVLIFAMQPLTRLNSVFVVQVILDKPPVDVQGRQSVKRLQGVRRTRDTPPFAVGNSAAH